MDAWCRCRRSPTPRRRPHRHRSSAALDSWRTGSRRRREPVLPRGRGHRALRPRGNRGISLAAGPTVARNRSAVSFLATPPPRDPGKRSPDGRRLAPRDQVRRLPDSRFDSRTGARASSAAEVWTGRRSFPDSRRAAHKLPAREAVLDGEIVILRADGTSDFSALQRTIGGANPDGTRLLPLRRSLRRRT